MRPLAAATVVPGHGPAFHDDAPISATLDYLHFVLQLARDARAAGHTPLQAAREADLGHFAKWPDAERIAGNLHRAYADLDPTVATSVEFALSDMVTYNDGRPLHCVA